MTVPPISTLLLYACFLRFEGTNVGAVSTIPSILSFSAGDTATASSALLLPRLSLPVFRGSTLTSALCYDAYCTTTAPFVIVRAERPKISRAAPIFSRIRCICTAFTSFATIIAFIFACFLPAILPRNGAERSHSSEVLLLSSLGVRMYVCVYVCMCSIYACMYVCIQASVGYS